MSTDAEEGDSMPWEVKESRDETRFIYDWFLF